MEELSPNVKDETYDRSDLFLSKLCNKCAKWYGCVSDPFSFFDIPKTAYQM